MQEFDFWGGTAQPHNFGGIFELRTYDIFSGRLLEWEQHWRKGLECRKQVMEPVGAWFTQLGHLNRVQHLWQFADLEHRKISREKCWELPGWADTVHETVKLIDKMESNILIPLKFSPLKVSFEDFSKNQKKGLIWSILTIVYSNWVWAQEVGLDTPILHMLLTSLFISMIIINYKPKQSLFFIIIYIEKTRKSFV